jgi:tyrosyl-tRNA synthetase
MFGKVMSWNDSLIGKGFELCTEIDTTKIDIKQNPRDLKMKLAFEVVKIYHGEKKAKEAEENFINTFQKKEIPEEMEEIFAKSGELVSEVLVKNNILSSKGEWRRLVLGNAIHDLNKKENITDQNIKVAGNLTLKVGKKRFVKITQE